MKKISYFIVTLMLMVSSAIAQTTGGDKVLGVWLSEKKDAKIEIFKSGNQYSGKLIWGTEMYEADGKTPLKDSKNPNTALRNRTRLNLVIVSDLSYNDGDYTDGHLYDARSGKTYSLKMKMQGDNILAMRGYYGVSLFGQTMQWTRVK